MEEINTIDDLVLKLTNVKLPWDEFCPNELTNWLNVFARSHGTTKELTLLGILPTVGALFGKTELKLFSTHKERGNMYCIALASSGAGKIPAAQISCSRPIVNHLEVKIGDDKQILVDNSSVPGLFSYFLNEKAVPVMCIDECQGFFNKMLHPSKSSNDQSLTMERMCKLYDGDAWYSVKGNKGKRVGTQFAAMSLVGYTTPKRFLQRVWGRVVENKNGFADRFLVFCCSQENISIIDKEEYSSQLDEFAISSLDLVYEKIYAEHNCGDPMEYKLTVGAKDVYQKFIAQSPQEGHQSDAKVSKNAPKLALVLHVFYDRLKKAIDSTVGPVPRNIPEHTMKMAISLCSTFSHVKALMDLVSFFCFFLLFNFPPCLSGKIILKHCSHF